ncbi:GNAT family N-acetyltransferase [Variovorax boronicumulans]|uniref:GNAT family N-acetyltransferase n=1 Tax=Variovorax boronicumulans TaxID=436515 RepID=UPI001C5A4686
MTLRIVPASLEDAAAVARIHVEAWRAAYEGIIPAPFLAAMSVSRREAAWRESIARGAPEVLVAKGAAGVVGWIAFGASRDADADAVQAEVHAIYLAPDHWAQGIGGLLWTEARRRLALQGFERVSLWVLAENARALRFYRAMGLTLDPTGQKDSERGGKRLLELRYVMALAQQEV